MPTDFLLPVETILNNVATRISGLVVALDSKVEMLRQKVESDLQSLRKSLGTLNDSVSNLSVCVQEHKKQTADELANLQTSLTSIQSSHNTQLNNKLDTLSTDIQSKLDPLNTSLFQHKQQTAAKLAHLQTSLNSKLDSLTATAIKLSSDHQEIQINISNAHCTDTQQSLQSNLTHQLDTIKDGIESPLVYSCGGTGGWRRAVYLNTIDPHTTCPSGWNITGYSKRTCGRNNTGRGTCDSATFPVSGGEYSRVCGRIRAYQWGAVHAFYSYHNGFRTTIDDEYATGVSVTHGSPRNHIWTFVAGMCEEYYSTWSAACPCDTTSTIRIPPFVGNDYFCESGVNEPWEVRHRTFHPNDTLWDGEDCLPSSTCCSERNPPYFIKQLPSPTTDDIEARICFHAPLYYSNLAVELVEIYIK